MQSDLIYHFNLLTISQIKIFLKHSLIICNKNNSVHYNSVWFHIFLSLSDANVKFLLELSSEFQISRVKERCEQFLKNQECSLANLVVAEKYNLYSLYKRCMDFAKTKTLEELDSSAECKKLSPQTLLKIYHAKIQMLRDYSKELTQKDRQTIKDCENLRMEKENMKRSLQGIYGLWETPSKRCYRHIADSAFNYSCPDCNEKIYFEVRKLCGEGQHLRRYFPKQPDKKS